MKYVTRVADQSFEIEIDERGTVVVDGQPHAVDLQEIVPDRLYSLLLDNVSNESFAEGGQAGHFRVLLRGQLYHVQVEDERAIRLSRTLTGFTPDSGEIPVRAPMPGLIVSIPAQARQPVRQGDLLVILESMKMDNELRAPRDGEVARVHVAEGDSVETGQALVTLS